MKTLLIVAHGSRRQSSNEEVLKLAHKVAQQPGHDFASVSAAFLEIAQPSIATGLERCIEDGADEVVIFPYFLAAGRHVADDIPAEVAQAQERYPEVKMSITGHLGMSPDMIPLILNLIDYDMQ